tara:strand:- start:100 stop:324 length:225 start_codon:yes stop_codon:yes gene_type:complete
MIDLKSEKGKSLTKKEVLKLLKGYLEEQIELARRKSIDEDNFSLPSWSEFQAYQLGIQKALHKVNNLIPDQGDK